ncbi:hypothetical protein SAMN05660691_01087 [Rheinheimera pacifica]|uniref:Uncharacterized protein n=1 Tax=Rheinheimera pacifica TaxID=173990 RepID=A0A1H6KHJ2_9GAMM|nr:hypothetical protein [Rheinheimera pacifica]SEH73071.1 hypothetical protein SAMN05660691_01087 [Rheinheimera pacifica]
MKKLMLIAALISSPIMAGESDWAQTDQPNVYTSLDIVSGKLSAMIKTYKDGSLRFGLFLPYEKCYVAESYTEPFASLIVVGGHHDFKLQCLGKNKAVVYSDDAVNVEIINALIKDGNVCLTIEEAGDSVKMCFSGKGVKELKELARVK